MTIIENKPKHSRLGASNSHRWIKCSASVKLSDKAPKQAESIYALEGSIAHTLAEMSIKSAIHPKNLKEVVHDEKLVKIDEEMADAVAIYFDYINEKAKNSNLELEVKLDLSFIDPEMFGTADAIIYNKENNYLEIVDYKHGAGIAVDVKKNTQLIYYAIGAYNYLKTEEKIGETPEIKITIVQPRSYHKSGAIRSDILSFVDLMFWKDVFALMAKKTKEPNPEFNIGDWCGFCPAISICPKLQKEIIRTAKAAFSKDPLTESDIKTITLPNPKDLTLNDVKKILDFASIISSWIKSVEEYAYNIANDGVKIDGYKLVRKRANRKWQDEKDVISQILESSDNLKESDLITKPKLKSPAMLEKLVDKNLVSKLCFIPDSGTTLVSISDKRPEIESNLLTIKNN